MARLLLVVLVVAAAVVAPAQGYASGQQPIPTYPATFSVLSFGAKGDGSDDAPAFQAAVDAAAAVATAATPQAVFIPPGNYTLNATVDISSSYTVLRGAGVGQTNLYMPFGLDALYGPQSTSWAFAGGFVGMSGINPFSRTMQPLAMVTAAATRGDTRLYVSSTAPFTVGKWLLAGRALAGSQQALAATVGRMFTNPWLQAAASEAAVRDWGILPPGSLPAVPAAATTGARKPSKFLLTAAKYAVAGAYSHWMEDQAAQAAAAAGGATIAGTAGVAVADPYTIDAYLYGDNLVDSGTPSKLFPKNDRLRMPFKVTAVGDGWIELDRPLPIDLRLGWQPAVYPYAPTVQHSGIEDLTFEFRWDTYTEHLDSKGYNGIGVYDVANCWVRNIQFIDCTSGVFTEGTEFLTVQNISFHITKPRGTGDMASRGVGGVDGHHTIMMGHGAYNVISGWRQPQTRYFHDMSVDSLLHLSVVHDGSGIDINLDAHKAATHNNLFVNIDMGRMSRPFQSGGDKGRGAQSGGNTTWWGIYSSNATAPPAKLPACDFGAYLNWIGRFAGSTQPPTPCNTTRWTVENSGAGRQLTPRDLFAAQRELRGLVKP